MRSRVRPLLLVGALLFGSGVAVGGLWYHLYLFPLPQLHDWVSPPDQRVPLSGKMVITTYTAQTPVFVDRQYFDSIGDTRLEGLYLLQIPRHHSDSITIRAREPVTIFRFVPDDQLEAAFDGWTRTDIPISVRGWSTTHTHVVTKDFPAGIIRIGPGGPVSSSPVLLRVRNDTASAPAFEVLNQKDFIYRKKR